MTTPLPKLGQPAIRALASIGVDSVEGIAQKTQDELLALHGFGPKALDILAAKAGLTYMLHNHRDGTVWAKGWLLSDKAFGYWEWFRKSGTKLRSGYFHDGKQVGEWVTYDAKGNVYKITQKKI